MLRTVLLFAALTAPGISKAAELWCMPDTLCNATGCKPTTNEEVSVRLQDLQASTTTLRTHAEDVAMERTRDGDVVQWQGVNANGAAEYLAWRQSDMEFTYLIRSDGREYSATGLCEVQ
jgi:hypothetical protein